jgi:hypothetical protein
VRLFGALLFVFNPIFSKGLESQQAQS